LTSPADKNVDIFVDFTVVCAPKSGILVEKAGFRQNVTGGTAIAV